MDCCFGALNTKGFSSSLQNNILPLSTHLTYEGCFNELKYTIGPKAKKSMELYLGYSRAQNAESIWDAKVNDYLSIFTKGSKDGEDRDQRTLNSVIVLDISGSMGSGLTNMGEGCRLQLAKQAILMFFSKLRQTDSFGLVTFNNQGHTLIPLQRVCDLNIDDVTKTVKGIHTNGGTTLITGFKQAMKNFNSFEEKQKQSVKPLSVENRIVMLTDVEDNSISQAYNFISEIQKTQIHSTIIGISDSFRSQVCEKLIEVKGFNYFCATELEDLKKYLFQNFAYTFFPSNYDIQISVENENIQSIQVFGTVDKDKVHLYNAEREGNKFIVTKPKTSFPSQLQLHQNGEVLTYGGLMMVKLKFKTSSEQSNIFEGKVHLNYSTIKGQKCHQQYPFRYESPVNEQFFSAECLHEAVDGFMYVYEVKNILEDLQKNGSKQKKEKYLHALEKMTGRIPKSKDKELEDLIKTMKGQLGQGIEEVHPEFDF